MRPVNLVLIALALFAMGFTGAYFIADRFGTTVEGKPLIGGPFSLIGPGGKRVTDEEFRGKLMLVFFGYTHCPDVCPTELQTMAELLEKLGPNAVKIAPIFISVDPDRDTPELLSSYVKNFNAHIIGLTGDRESVASAAKAFRVYYRKVGNSADDYSVDHSAFAYLLDENGNYISHFAFNATPETMLTVIKKHLPAGKSA